MSLFRKIISVFVIFALVSLTMSATASAGFFENTGQSYAHEHSYNADMVSHDSTAVESLIKGDVCDGDACDCSVNSCSIVKIIKEDSSITLLNIIEVIAFNNFQENIKTSLSESLKRPPRT